MKTMKVGKFPACDFCSQPAPYDAPTIPGPWANMCEACFVKQGHDGGLGTKRILRGSKQKKSSETLIALWPNGYEAAMEQAAFDSVVEVQCPNCGEQRSVEPDADYTYVCEGCDSQVKVPSLF